MTWWALAMTFDSLPGMCLVAYSFQCGYEGRRPALREFVRFLGGTYRAKNEAIKDTARLICGRNAAVGALLITLIIACVATDTLMLLTVNSCAVLVSFLSYRLGRKHRLAAGASVKEHRTLSACGRYHCESGLWKPAALILLAWLSLVATALGVAYVCRFWQPH